MTFAELMGQLPWWRLTMDNVKGYRGKVKGFMLTFPAFGGDMTIMDSCVPTEPQLSNMTKRMAFRVRLAMEGVVP